MQALSYPLYQTIPFSELKQDLLKKFKRIATIYARILNQCKFKYHILYSARFYNVNEKDQRYVEIELFINLNLNITESVINIIDVKSQLEQRIQIQKTKESGWIFDKIRSKKMKF